MIYIYKCIITLKKGYLWGLTMTFHKLLLLNLILSVGICTTSNAAIPIDKTGMVPALEFDKSKNPMICVFPGSDGSEYLTLKHYDTSTVMDLGYHDINNSSKTEPMCRSENM